MTPNRYVPSLSLTVAGTEVKDDISALTCDFSVTDQVQAIEFDLNNLADKYATFMPFDTAILKLNDVQRFYGRVDSCVPEFSKPGARVLKVKGRQIAGSALQDIAANLQFVDEHPCDIVEGIIDAYNDLKGAADPEITIGNNLAPTDISMSFRWQRKNFWKMLNELQQALGAPELEGGKDEFFDFWIAPETEGTFYFENAGFEDSTVVVPDNTELMKAKRIVDATALKNDIWLWCNSQAGRIPLEMQLTYLTGLADTWTEGNAADYESYNHSDKPAPTIEDYTTDQFVGSKSIRISGSIGAIGGGGLTPAEKNAYWYMDFEHGGKFHTKLSGFTNQYPNDMLNFLNETHMGESMGEVFAIAFYLKTLSDSWPFEIQCVDVNNHRVHGPQINSKQTTGCWYNPFDQPKTEWANVIMTIGPSANWSLMSGDSFDWMSVKQVRFVFGGKTGPFDFLFDGFRFIKPLVVHTYSTSDGVRRSAVVAKEGITSYASAKLIANALLEEQMKPQVYWDMEEIGRDDIPSGSKFTLGSTELLMREQRWQFSKDAGWILTGKAWEKT